MSEPVTCDLCSAISLQSISRGMAISFWRYQKLWAAQSDNQSQCELCMMLQRHLPLYNSIYDGHRYQTLVLRYNPSMEAVVLFVSPLVAPSKRTVWHADEKEVELICQAADIELLCNKGGWAFYEEFRDSHACRLLRVSRPLGRRIPTGRRTMCN